MQRQGERVRKDFERNPAGRKKGDRLARITLVPPVSL